LIYTLSLISNNDIPKLYFLSIHELNLQGHWRKWNKKTAQIHKSLILNL
jgi:hypothetical protein